MVIDSILKYPDIRDQLILLLTYHTNRIEGSTLTEDETAAILFQNTALPNKTFTEQLEAKNHQTAIEFLFNFVAQKKTIDDNLVLELHRILMNGIRDDAGTYRNHPVMIVGANIPTANCVKIPELMSALADQINQKGDPIDLATKTHSEFEKIHPFSDGNGRVGRLLMQAILLSNDFVPAIIRQENRKQYMDALNLSQSKQDFAPPWKILSPPPSWKATTSWKENNPAFILLLARRSFSEDGLYKRAYPPSAGEGFRI